MPDWLNAVLDKIALWLEAHAVTILVIFIIAIIIHLVGRKLVGRTIRKVVNIDTPLPGDIVIEKKRQDTLIRIIDGLLGIIVWVVAIMMALSEAGIPIGPMLAAAGVAGLAIGFGGQYLIRDLITGMFIIIENQYRIGDTIQIEATNVIFGEVEDITLRKTTLRDIDGSVHHIPHGEITIVTNLSRSYSTVNLDIGISYGADIEKAAAVIDRVGRELSEDPDWRDEIIEAPAFLRVQDLADSAVILRIRGNTRPGEQWNVAGEMRKRVKLAFDAEGIEIPFPQRVIHKAD